MSSLFHLVLAITLKTTSCSVIIQSINLSILFYLLSCVRGRFLAILQLSGIFSSISVVSIHITFPPCLHCYANESYTFIDFSGFWLFLLFLFQNTLPVLGPALYCPNHPPICKLSFSSFHHLVRCSLHLHSFSLHISYYYYYYLHFL